MGIKHVCVPFWVVYSCIRYVDCLSLYKSQVYMSLWYGQLVLASQFLSMILTYMRRSRSTPGLYRRMKYKNPSKEDKFW